MKNLSLYQITNTFPMIMESEEMTEELKDQLLEELNGLLQQKSQNIIGYTKNIELTIDAMRAEEKRISELRKELENRVVKFKQYVKDCMELNGFKKIETPLGTLSIAKNPISVEVVDESEIPSEYKIETVETKIDKKAIADNFKATGEIPNGVYINTQNTSLRIK